MRAAVLALALVAATAAPAGWSYMDDSTACLHDGLSSTFMTCALPASSTYDNAFNLAASLPRCGVPAAGSARCGAPGLGASVCSQSHPPSPHFRSEAGGRAKKVEKTRGSPIIQ